jgi:RNA polymerase sigma factor FliA
MSSRLRAAELPGLWHRYKVDDDERARERLVVDYAPLVEEIAGRIAHGLPAHVEQADLVSYGFVGLIGAIERFDPGREVPFEAFASARIRGAIVDELRSLDWIPRSVRSRAREVENAHAALEARLGRAPTDEEMAETLGISIDELRGAVAETANPSILGVDDLGGFAEAEGCDPISVFHTGKGPAVSDPYGEAQAGELSDRLADAVESLPHRERLVIALRYYEEMTLREIGELLDVTESRVSQLHTKAVVDLRSRFRP